MFSLPSVPTDNLYKFIFISSIVLFIYTSYSLQNLSIELSKEVVALDSTFITFQGNERLDSIKLNRTKEKIKEWATSLESIEKEQNILIKQKKSQTPQYKSVIAKYSILHKTLIAEQVIQDSLKDKSNQDEIKRLINRSKFKSRMRLYKQTLRDADLYKVISLILFFIGSVTWLIRVQIPQDKLIDLTIQLSEAQLRKALKDENTVQPNTNDTEQPDETTA